jgi:hypothetical protein
MLRELPHVRQVPGDRYRRWFSNEALEVVVWYEPTGSIFGFQICYDLQEEPRALTWTPKSGFSHAAVDGGEDSVMSNRSPMLRPGAIYDAGLLDQAFHASSAGLPAPEKRFIEDKLAESVRPA